MVVWQIPGWRDGENEVDPLDPTEDKNDKCYILIPSAIAQAVSDGIDNQTLIGDYSPLKQNFKDHVLVFDSSGIDDDSYGRGADGQYRLWKKFYDVYTADPPEGQTYTEEDRYQRVLNVFLNDFQTLDNYMASL